MYVLRMGCKAVGPMCCVTRVKEPSALIIPAYTYLSESLFILKALSTLFGRYVRYIRQRYIRIAYFSDKFVTTILFFIYYH